MLRDLRITVMCLFSFITVLTLCGCMAGGGREQGGEVIARINDYTLTEEDFKNEAELLAPTKYFSEDMSSAKQMLLDDMIEKKILLMEAQREDFDKEEAFMKEIERYWEQALLKRLMKKKMKEFLRTISVGDDEVREEYDRISKESGGHIEPFEKISSEIRSDILHRKMQTAFDLWVEGLKKNAKIEINKDNLNKMALE